MANEPLIFHRSVVSWWATPILDYRYVYFCGLCIHAFHCNGAATNDMQIRKRVMWIDHVMNRAGIIFIFRYLVFYMAYPRRNPTRSNWIISEIVKHYIFFQRDRDDVVFWWCLRVHVCWDSLPDTYGMRRPESWNTSSLHECCLVPPR